MNRILIVGAIAMILAACGGGEGPTAANENGSEPILDSSSDVSPDDSDIENQDPNQASMDSPSGETGGLPIGFPQAFPLPDPIVIAADFSYPEDGDFQIMLDYSQTLDDALVFFRDSLPAAGWTILSEEEFSNDTGRSVNLEVLGEGFDGRVLILEGEEGVGIQIQLAGETSFEGDYSGDFDGEIVRLGDRSNGLPEDLPVPAGFTQLDVPQELATMGYRVAFQFEGPVEDAAIMMEDGLYTAGWIVLFAFEDDASQFYELEISDADYSFEGTVSLTDSPEAVGLDGFEGTLIAIREGLSESD